jgi:hypothetical protein
MGIWRTKVTIALAFFHSLASHFFFINFHCSFLCGYSQGCRCSITAFYGEIMGGIMLAIGT